MPLTLPAAPEPGLRAGTLRTHLRTFPAGVLENPERDLFSSIEFFNKQTQKMRTMTESGSDALKNLVIFIAALAVFGTILALTWYFAVDLPVQQAAALHAPANTWPYTAWKSTGAS